MSDYRIVARPGAFGNHLRWLCCLDKKFDLTTNVIELLLDNYARIKGNDWPRSETLSPDGILELPEAIQQDMAKYFPVSRVYQYANNTLPSNKVAFITDNVYNDSRSWHNWLQTESLYRSSLDDIIPFSHDYVPDELSKTIILTASSNLAYKSYLKFLSNLRGLTVDQFKKLNAEFNKQVSATISPNVLVLDSDLLYTETLDRDLYNAARVFFELDDNYTYAQKIHRLWFDLHKKAEREFVRDITELYKEE